MGVNILRNARQTLTSDFKVGGWGSYDPTSVSSCSLRDGEHRLEVLTCWPIILQISGGREIAVAVAVATAAALALDADGLTLMASCALQDPPERSIFIRLFRWSRTFRWRVGSRL